MSYTNNQFSVLADIGGTNTRIALADGTRLLDETIRRYPNANYPDLETVIGLFCEELGGVDAKGACVAVAGPVADGVGSMTNLDWTIDEATLARATGAEVVAILNDLQAQGHGLDHLASDALTPILRGTTSAVPSESVKLVVGVGTGFNTALVVPGRSGKHVPPSESGHASLPVRSDEDIRLSRFVEQEHGFAAVEDVLSGRGLERIYSWLSAEAKDPSTLKAADIMAALEEKDDPRSTQAVEVFVRMLGTVCGNLSLIQLPFGGVYLVGGVARAMAPYLERFNFAQAFADKGRFSEFMDSFSVSVVEDDYAALVGSATYLSERTG